jgi:hypothetical protein
MKLVLELEKEVADLLKQYVWQINHDFTDDWTEETLAASFLAHILLDTAATELDRMN